MKVSDINGTHIKEYIRLDDDCNEEMLEEMKKAAIAYVKSFTAMSDEELDEHEDISIAVLVLIQDMYDNRAYQTEKQVNTNKVVDSILHMYRKNLI